MSGAGEEKQQQEKRNWKQELAREGRIGAALIEDNGFLSQEVLSIASKRAEQERLREGVLADEVQHSVIDRCRWIHGIISRSWRESFSWNHQKKLERKF